MKRKLCEYEMCVFVYESHYFRWKTDYDWKNRHTSFVTQLNFKSCISHSAGFQKLLYCEYALWTRPGSTSGYYDHRADSQYSNYWKPTEWDTQDLKFSRFTKLVCLFFPVIVCERSARVENCPAQEPLFSEWRALNMARRFFL